MRAWSNGTSRMPGSEPRHQRLGTDRRRSHADVCRPSSTISCCSTSACPTRTGLQALRALRAVADLTPIIVLTGSDDYKQGLIAVREGAQDYLEKRRVNAGMLSRIVSYSVERNNFHRDLVRATRRYQDLFNNVPVALFTANHDGVLKTANAACVKLLACQGIPHRQGQLPRPACSSPASARTSSISCRASAWSKAGKPTIQDCEGREAPRPDQHRAAVRRDAGVRGLGRLHRRHLDAQADARRARPARGQPAPGAEARSHRPARRGHRARDQYADAIRRRQPALPQGIVRRARTRCSRSSSTSGGEPASKLLGEARLRLSQGRNSARAQPVARRRRPRREDRARDEGILASRRARRPRRISTARSRARSPSPATNGSTSPRSRWISTPTCRRCIARRPSSTRSCST